MTNETITNKKFKDGNVLDSSQVYDTTKDNTLNNILQALTPVYTKTIDSNGWTVLDFGTHKEYVYKLVETKSFATGNSWGRFSGITLPAGMDVIGENRILTCSCICVDTAIRLNAGAAPTSTTIQRSYCNVYSAAVNNVPCMWQFRILEYK